MNKRMEKNPVEKTSYHHGDLRNAILDVAEDVLAVKSLDAVSMRELARKAGVSPGAPYHHFEDRHGLVAALCQRGFLRLGESLSSARDRSGIKGMIKEYLSFAQGNHALYQLMFSAEATAGDPVIAIHPYADPVFSMLEDEVTQLQSSRAVESASQTAVSIWCFIHGLACLTTASPLQRRLGRKSLSTFAHESIQQLIGK